MGRNTYNPLTRTISVSLNEITTKKGVSVSASIYYINNLAVELGQTLSLMRQRGETPTEDDLERLENKCWAIMGTIEDIS